jgi:hypothetical protein
VALTYDVGFFNGLGIAYFSLFSLAEHLVFALGALPFALATVISIPALATLVILLTRLMRRMLPPAIMKLFNLHYFIPILLILITLALTAFGFDQRFIFFPAFAVCVLATMMVARINFRLELLLPATIIVSSFFMTFAVASDIGRAQFRKAPSHTLETSAGQLPGILIRGGERGVLFYDPNKKEISFQRWDTIIRITSKPKEN